RYRNMPGFTNPSQLYYDKQIKIKKVADVNIVTLNQIRNELFPEIKKDIRNLLDNNAGETIAIRTPQGSGKSHFSDELIQELTRDYNITTVLAVPRAELAKARA